MASELVITHFKWQAHGENLVNKYMYIIVHLQYHKQISVLRICLVNFTLLCTCYFFLQFSFS